MQFFMLIPNLHADPSERNNHKIIEKRQKIIPVQEGALNTPSGPRLGTLQLAGFCSIFQGLSDYV
jgi:hypothetical protein